MDEKPRRVKMFSQPKGYTCDGVSEVEGDTVIHDGWPHSLRWIDGVLERVRKRGPTWARGYDKDVDGVWHWLNRRTQFGAKPYPVECSTQTQEGKP